MERVALKVQRRRHARPAVYEVFVHLHILNRTGPSEDIVHLHEAFLHDGHVCMAYEQHGRSLEAALARGPLPLGRARRVTRQMLQALERFHRCGYAHTDVKPENILYRARDGEARLSDLGCADNQLRQGAQPGTREYLSPEILLGAPLTPSLDMWCLGCTVFEMLTGRVLFQPRRAARKKYREFSRGKDAIVVPLGESVLRDRAEEKGEQLRRGEVVAGKYRVLRKLGDGGFATVWSAERISDLALDGSYETLWGYAQRQMEEAPTATEREQTERDWRRAKGADDLLDLVLNYEHVLQMAALCGPFPPEMIAAGRFRSSFFESDGALRFRPQIPRTSLGDRLRRSTRLRGQALREVADFLKSLLAIDPATRVTAMEALRHSWLERE